MPDALPRPAGVAVVPCFNEGSNPIGISRALLEIPDLTVAFVDDASDAPSREVLDSLAGRDARVRVVRNAARAGKVASLIGVLRGLDPSVERIVLLDCDVDVPAVSVQKVLDALEGADLVLANARAITSPRTIWERGAIFSANRHARLCERALDRCPALCTNGRLLGMSRRLADAVLRSDVPRHTEDAHFMLVCLAEGYRYAFLPGAELRYRAPDTLEDYLRQSNRFSQGRALLRERWDPEVLEKYYDPKAGDLAATFLAQALRDPAGALAFLTMLAAKRLRAGAAPPQGGAWAVAASTKVLR